MVSSTTPKPFSLFVSASLPRREMKTEKNMKFSGHVFIFISCVCMGLTNTYGELERLEHPAKDDGSLSFLVVGDWGRKGAYNQTQVAQQMGQVGENMDFNFIISTGDNFYDDGLTSIKDVAFEESFTNIYTARSLQKQWYNVLGNHDYRGNVEAQLNPILSKIDGRWFCKRSFIVNAEVAEIFFVDTTPFQTKYFTNPEDHTYDWSGVMPRYKYLATVLKDVESALKLSTAKWKIVVGHHTIRSAGHHGDTVELIDHLLPILEANDVDFYINGHDHCLQHISSTESKLQFLTSGGGSKAWKKDFEKNKNGLQFYYDGQEHSFVKGGMINSSLSLSSLFVYSSRQLHHQPRTEFACMDARDSWLRHVSINTVVWYE